MFDAEPVKKNMLGVYKSCEESEATHIVIEIDDYDELVEKADRSDKDYSRLKTALDRSEKMRKESEVLVNRQRARINEMSRQLQTAEKAGKEVSRLMDENGKLRAAVKRFQEDSEAAKLLNENLKRICRERANQARDIRPKKEHDGYIVLSSREWTEKLPNGSQKTAWKTVLQTPYDASITLDAVRREIYRELSSYVLPDLHCGYANDPDENGMYSESEENCMFRWNYTADYRTGFWTVTIYTTDSLSVPIERRRIHNGTGALRFQSSGKRRSPAQKSTSFFTEGSTRFS